MLTQEPTAEPASYRLSPQQEQLWRRDPDGPQLTAQCLLDVGDVDAQKVREALARIVERHEILRTTFIRPQGMKLPAQVIHDRLDIAWREDDQAQAVLDLEHGPIVDASLGDGNGHRLLALTLPAVCADAHSLALLASELQVEIAGTATALAEPLQYADYAEWRNESLAADGPPESIDDLPPSPELPFTAHLDFPAQGKPQRVTVPIDQDSIARGAAACRVAEPVFVEACWHACLARLAGDTDVLVGAVLDGRAHSELTTAIGPYAQVLPLTTTIEETTSIAQLVDRVRRVRSLLVEQQDAADAAMLTKAAQVCQVGFSSVALPRAAGIGSLLGAPSPFLLELRWFEDGDATRAELHVAPAFVESGTARLVAQTLSAITVAAAADPAAAVLDLPLAGRDQARAEQAAFAGPSSPSHNTTVTQLFERVAAASPDALAVVAPDGTLTYGELNARANQLAHRLRELGVERDMPIALCMERSSQSIIALLGALKAGGAYLPLNFEHPSARLSHQLAEAKALILLSQASLSDRLPPFDGIVLHLDSGEELEAQPDDNLEPVSEPNDLVYVMYTSGSTGTPKGAGVTHRNLVNYTIGILERLGLSQGRGVVFGAVSALSTDLGNTSIFPALLGGGTLHLVSPATALDGARFAEYVRSHPLDVLKLTPSHFRALLGAADAEAVLPRRWLVLGGEALSWQLIRQLRRARPSCRILNHYGPTETTIGTCTFEVGTAPPQGRTVPVGSPLPGTCAYVVDRQMRLLPFGVPGELYIGGEGVARGYLSRPAETKANFMPDPFTGAAGGRLYKTGDRVRALRDGNIEFLGRVDDQVKIRGYRVEPGEIEALLATHPGIHESAVVARPDSEEGHELVAYVVGTADTSTEDLQTFLRERVPPYMVPARFVRLDALPFTPSGKIDRRALPDPGAVARVVEYVAPRTPLEKELVRIWQELLGVEQVGVDDDFFALGGHSLLATQAVIRIRNSIAEVPLHSLFNAPTVAALAEAIVEAELAAADAAS